MPEIGCNPCFGSEHGAGGLLEDWRHAETYCWSAARAGSLVGRSENDSSKG